MRYKVNCQGSPSGNQIHIQSSRNSNYMKVARVVIFGIDGAAAPAQIFNEDNVGDPAVLERRDDGVKVWKPEIQEPVPFEVLEELGQKENAVETPIGYFAYAGYVDYSLGLDTNAEETKPDQPKENQTKPNFGQNDLQTAVSSFLRFNGFVEDGEITDEMIEFMQKERCGNADLAIGQDEDKCTDESSKINTPANQKALVSFLIPGRESTERAEPESYYLEVDVKFNNVRNGRSRSIFLGFNYQAESANGGDKPLEIVALRFLNNKLCVQFLTLFDGQFVSNLVSKETVLESCYTPNSNEEKTLSFKVRLDVYKDMAGILGVASLSIKGKEVAKNVYKTGIISSAVVMRDQGDIEVTLSRICKRWTLSDDGSTRRIKPTRRKRFAISKHKWETAENLIRFNFQNYSTALGQEGTRTGVIDALQLFSDAAGFNFQEVVPTATAEIVFMFIKGIHADQKTFHGNGVEKAHAFVPTHSEIHFNDFETFTMGQADGATSMLYVAAHEIGHALGILHSPQADALMKAGYPLNVRAFSFQHLHDDDVRAVKTLYPELSGTGRLEKLSTVAKETKYTPKIPFPTECYSHIDAALQVKEFAFIVSGPTIWKMRERV
ncbi:uncharacterized protein LOC134817167 [Bolinopsis microptera]|uniref:uncharacterized protein LOC134817167 n=1 Tax=Bolinopsis microptera TaxID=2820187 RepID=UPI00307B06D0